LRTPENNRNNVTLTLKFKESAKNNRTINRPRDGYNRNIQEENRFSTGTDGAIGTE